MRGDILAWAIASGGETVTEAELAIKLRRDIRRVHEQRDAIFALLDRTGRTLDGLRLLLTQIEVRQCHAIVAGMDRQQRRSKR